jgi:3-hydroxyacyl-[acyl-carrier-protein] dehydratase
MASSVNPEKAVSWQLEASPGSLGKALFVKKLFCNPWTLNSKMWYSLLALKKTDKDEVLADVTVAADSPWFTGHFPGNPILPAIAQLKMVADVLSLARGEELYIHRLSRVKFKKPVAPGALLTIYGAPAENQLYQFRITQKDQDVCSGTMSLTLK